VAEDGLLFARRSTSCPEEYYLIPRWEEGIRQLHPLRYDAMMGRASPVGMFMAQQRLGWFASIVGWFGARFIYLLIWLFGRKYQRSEVAWIHGPIGGPTIGDSTYREVCEAEGLTIERHARSAGLVPDWEALNSDTFDASRVLPMARDFYEHTSDYSMDVWSQTYFPAKIVLWILVKTISRQVNQLNFPLSPLDTSRGIISEIISMRRPDQSIRYTGWFRRFAHDDAVLYTGFYMTEMSPSLKVPCMKVVFPMPNGNATVLLRPELLPDGSLLLDSSGRHFGDAGFYRVQAVGTECLRVWHIRSLKERFHMYVDEAGILRCDHTIRFLGLPCLSLHYKLLHH
jgi:hypothetical protein